VEREIVKQEEDLERKVVSAVDAIEKEELFEENQLLETAKDALTVVKDVATPIVVPGVFLLVYAVFASFFSGPPVPCKGAEAEETRKLMGRKPRMETAKVSSDYGPGDAAVQA